MPPSTRRCVAGQTRGGGALVVIFEYRWRINYLRPATIVGQRLPRSASAATINGRRWGNNKRGLRTRSRGNARRGCRTMLRVLRAIVRRLLSVQRVLRSEIVVLQGEVRDAADRVAHYRRKSAKLRHAGRSANAELPMNSSHRQCTL